MPIRILTGDRPTGPLHLGHYVGSLTERLRFQNEGAECFIIIADYQVMTDRTDVRDTEKNIYEVMFDYLAVGLDPFDSDKKTTIFVQSRVPQLADLFMFLSMVTPVAKVNRNPTVKEEAKAAHLGSKMSLGMLSYPVSQAADILLFQPDYIPVGEEQLPHIEMTREIARSFNALYKETFKLPEAVVSNVPKLLGLDGSQKMSKSRNNAIYLSDGSDAIAKKIKTAVTDSGSEVTYDPARKPAVSSLMQIYKLASGHDFEAIEREFEGKGYGLFKVRLIEALNHFLQPIRMRRQAFATDRGQVAQMLRRGTNKAALEGTKTLQRVREAVTFDYSSIF